MTQWVDEQEVDVEYSEREVMVTKMVDRRRRRRRDNAIQNMMVRRASESIEMVESQVVADIAAERSS